MLNKPVELLEGVKEVLQIHCPRILIDIVTKGDLSDQDGNW
ncbi:MAG: hypothetical protein R2797_07970 [Gelidibacter sp.]